MKEIPTVSSPFFGAFPSDRVPKVKKDVNVFFIIISQVLYQRLPVNFISEIWEHSEAAAYNGQHTKAIKTSNPMAH